MNRSGRRLAVSGEIDDANAAALGEECGAALADGVTVLDLSGVTFFSAAGLRALLLLGPVARAHDVDLRVCCSRPVQRILDLCPIPGVAGLVLEGAAP